MIGREPSPLSPAPIHSVSAVPLTNVTRSPVAAVAVPPGTPTISPDPSSTTASRADLLRVGRPRVDDPVFTAM
ncbi:hypothetical protein TPA0908_52970 [Micromonospora sp. AKA38]|nr:hypothetical protein TPA0908_52970 [Micromonospora sp. AKA38]